MYDAISVLHEAFVKFGRKKAGEPTTNLSPSGWQNGSREAAAVCATGSVIGAPVPFELGERIGKWIRKVSGGIRPTRSRLFLFLFY